MDTVSGFTSVTKEEEDIRVKAKINLQQLHAFFLSPSAFFNGLLHLISIPALHPQLTNHGILQGHGIKTEDFFRGRIKKYGILSGVEL